MRSSKGTAQFLLAAFIIVAALAYFSAKDADKEQSKDNPQPIRQVHFVKPKRDSIPHTGRVSRDLVQVEGRADENN